VIVGTVAPRADAHALLLQALEIEIGGDDLRILREALGFRQRLAELEHRGLAVPGKIGGGFARAGGRIKIRGDAARRLRAAQQTPCLGLADRDVGSRQVDQHGGPGHRAKCRRRRRGPDVLANFDMNDEIGRIRRAEQEIGAERHLGVAESDRANVLRPARRKITLLVEFAVVRQVRLRHDAEQFSAMNDERAVEQSALQRKRRTDDHDRHPGAARVDDLCDLFGSALEQRLLKEQVVIGVGGNSKLGKQRNRALLVVSSLRQPQRLGAVGCRIGNTDFWDADRHARKTVTVDIVEHHAFRSIAGAPPVTRKALIYNSFHRDLREFLHAAESIMIPLRRLRPLFVHPGRFAKSQRGADLAHAGVDGGKIKQAELRRHAEFAGGCEASNLLPRDQ